MISNFFVIFSVAALACLVIFITWNLKTQNLQLIHKLYIALAVSYGLWLLALLLMKFVAPDNTPLLFVLDAVTNTFGAMTPTLYLCISMTFVGNWEHLPKLSWVLIGISLLDALVIWTNPLHHLQYQVFSIIKSEVVFGPFVIVSGVYCYLCLITAIVLMIHFAVRNQSRLYIMQGVLFAVGGLCPLVVSLISTVTSALPITATPIAFGALVVANTIAIYRLHLLDIKPMATQLVLNSISDAYVILSEQNIIISYNSAFTENFSKTYGLREGACLDDYVAQKGTGAKNTVIYNLVTAISSCRSSLTPIMYEQSIVARGEKGAYKNYYIAEISPVLVNGKYYGVIVLFKDVTQIKNSMQQLQENQTRMMEQERLASLGQMIGGLAHNLKTPIMSITGGIASTEALIEECRESIDDPEVVREDYMEIYGEMEEWLRKMQTSASYMSEIITAVKGQAATAVSHENALFSVDEIFKRVELLMRHSLNLSHNQLAVEGLTEYDAVLSGDINSLVQVVDNFISNAIFVQPEGGNIVLGVTQDDEFLKIYVKDHGPGVSPQVKDRLFKEMITMKGTQGTGLGLYISQAVVSGNFGGTLWYEDNPEGGAVFGLSIPLDRVVTPESMRQGEV